MLEARRESNVTFFRSTQLDSIPGLVHAFSTRRAEGRDLSLGGPGQPTGHHWDRFLAACGMPGWPVGRVRQVHSNGVHWVRDNEFLNSRQEGDAVGTSLRGIALGIATADCVPVLMADTGGRSVAAAHAGWRGTSEGVVRRTVEAMTAEAGIGVEQITVAIGPHIGVCCMEVGEEVFEWFADPEIFERRAEWPRPHLSLAKANRKQLIASGVADDRIEVSTLCTRCHSDLFHSYRRDGESAGRMYGLIGLQP